MASRHSQRTFIPSPDEWTLSNKLFLARLTLQQRQFTEFVASGSSIFPIQFQPNSHARAGSRSGGRIQAKGRSVTLVFVAIATLVLILRSPCCSGSNDEFDASTSSRKKLGRVRPVSVPLATFSYTFSCVSGGGDPYLSGEVAFETVTGIQSAGVQACAKHYINKYVTFCAKDGD